MSSARNTSPRLRLQGCMRQKHCVCRGSSVLGEAAHALQCHTGELRVPLPGRLLLCPFPLLILLRFFCCNKPQTLSPSLGPVNPSSKSSNMWTAVRFTKKYSRKWKSTNIKNAWCCPTRLIIRQSNNHHLVRKILNFNLQGRRKATPQGFNALISNDFQEGILKL